MDGSLLLYGSYGYTGSLIAEAAVDAGDEPILAGRNGERVRAQADDLDCEAVVVALDEGERLREVLADVDLVLNCAGPFAVTAEPMVDACLDAGTDYADVTGEIEVFEALAGRDEAAAEAGVTLLPGVGFDVVPSDCLAAHLDRRLPTATSLSLAFDGLGSPSRGTARTMLQNLGESGYVRRDGRLVSVPPGWGSRRIDFGDGERRCTTIPWGDVATAYRTTGIPNVDFWLAVSPATLRAMRFSRYLGPLLGTDTVQRGLEWAVDRFVEGPDEQERAETETRLWGAATAPNGERVVTRLRTPNPYAVTVEAALTVARRLLAEDVDPGYETPASAFGPDLVLELDGVEREDVE